MRIGLWDPLFTTGRERATIIITARLTFLSFSLRKKTGKMQAAMSMNTIALGGIARPTARVAAKKSVFGMPVPGKSTSGFSVRRTVAPATVAMAVESKADPIMEPPFKGITDDIKARAPLILDDFKQVGLDVKLGRFTSFVGDAQGAQAARVLLFTARQVVTALLLVSFATSFGFQEFVSEHPVAPAAVVIKQGQRTDGLVEHVEVAGVQQPVGFVEHKELHLREVELAALHEVVDAPRRAAHDVDALAQLLELRGGDDAADEQRGRAAQRVELGGGAFSFGFA